MEEADPDMKHVTQALYLDYDGPMHADDVYLSRSLEGERVPRMGRIGRTLFENAPMLARLLEPYPDLPIILSTSWVMVLGFDKAKSFLIPDLQRRVIGGVFHREYFPKSQYMYLYRGDQVRRDVHVRNLTKWVALDDDPYGWEGLESHVCLVNRNTGLGDSAAQAQLAALLAAQFSPAPAPNGV